MDIGPKRRTVSIGILRRKIFALICCNIFLVITKCCYGKMTIQTCIHTTCPSITKSFLEDEMQKLGANQKLKSGIFYVLKSKICTGRIRNPASGGGEFCLCQMKFTCSHLCVPETSVYKCACSNGLSLEQDGKNWSDGE